ncbi:MAG: protein translocase subunit SecD [Acidimicrobiia bacterium]|nr:protein translocase subunit SecD [Acidimicrobiia bacterium]MYB23857.1 protein translocase subunit SecD [Acidimicrobiia bacterium]MYJ13782.1 protein translocase subunit SecD [Acidimicrobiia bacterium]
MIRRLLAGLRRNRSLVAIVVIAVGLLVGNLTLNQEPLLGLDLQGGVEVVLRPAPAETAPTQDDLEQALEIIRNRVDALGVAEPDITVAGGNIVVQLPGVDDQDRAINLVGQTAELRFRPLLARSVSRAEIEEYQATVEASSEEDSSGDEEAPDAAVPSELNVQDLLEGVLTDPGDDEADATVILPSRPDADGEVSHFLMGPALVTGSALESATAVLEFAQWNVQVTALEGAEGIDRFNAAAGACYFEAPDPLVCPTGTLGIVLDGVVESAPVVNAPAFERDRINITGAFNETEARDLALVLDYGALPLVFEDPAEAGLVRTVSATLGRDALRAGLIAGIVGLGLVALYMLVYYRFLGLAALGSLGVSGVLLWVIVSFLSETRGLALTLAGVTGLIVAIGVSLDSNVVYFEHLKEDVLGGRTLRSSVEQAFPVAFRTIFWANLATLIGAVILWLLTIGSVRGFAAMLAFASILDLIATYFFLRPVVRGLARWSAERPALVGMATVVAAAGAAAGDPAAPATGDPAAGEARS